MYQGKKEADKRWQGDILDGERNDTLASLAGDLFRKGLNPHQVHTKLSEENAIRCKPPLESGEVAGIVESIKKVSGTDKKSYKTQWQERVNSSEQLNSGETRTLIQLSFYMDIDGTSCFPSQDLIAEKTHTTRQSVNKHLKKAKELGYITTYDKKPDNGAAWHKGYIASLPNHNDVTPA